MMLFACALRYLCSAFKGTAVAKHRSQHNLAQFISISHIFPQISQFLTTFAVSFTTLDTA